MPKKGRKGAEDGEELSGKMEQLSTEDSAGKKKGKKKGKKPLDPEEQERKYAEKMAFLLGEDDAEPKEEVEEEDTKKKGKKGNLISQKRKIAGLKDIAKV